MTGRRAVAFLMAAAAATAGFPHGASRGLHLHLIPQATVPGGTVSVELDAAQPMARVRCGIAGLDVGPKPIEPARPMKKMVVKIQAPTVAPGTIVSVVAEVTTLEGATYRASALLTVVQPSGDARTEPLALRAPLAAGVVGSVVARAIVIGL